MHIFLSEFVNETYAVTQYNAKEMTSGDVLDPTTIALYHSSIFVVYSLHKNRHDFLDFSSKFAHLEGPLLMAEIGLLTNHF